ncbi:MAG: PTS fructose transporter subunit IIA [Desulfobacterales bacterium]|nr:PTS fructose transporter subunit IIA [Desulfobacterales bacterium]MDJ0914992.1 PTS fructose transporter subunit IIA [Desulfobacterales bacterium]
MIGIVIVTHSNLGDALIEASEFILGRKSEAVVAVSIDINENAEKLHKKIAEGIKRVDAKKGILILTDMFGGTPSNLSYSFLEENKVEVLSGVNLPIVVSAINQREKSDLTALADQVLAAGRKSISLASSILKGNKRSED